MIYRKLKTYLFHVLFPQIVFTQVSLLRPHKIFNVNYGKQANNEEQHNGYFGELLGDQGQTNLWRVI